MVKIFLCIVTLTVTLGVCSQQRLSPKEFKKQIAHTTDALLLDIRTSEETAKGYLKGAVFIDFYDSTFQQQVSAIDRERPVFIYCAIGGRSWDAAQLMHTMGFKNVVDLKGGIIVWKIKNYPFIKLKNDAERQGMNKSSFETSVAAQPLSFVDFYAPWCGPCKIMVPALENIEKEMKDSVHIIKINADENLQLMKDYGLKALPYILVLQGTKIVFRQEGFMSEADMKAIIRKYYVAR